LPARGTGRSEANHGLAALGQASSVASLSACVAAAGSIPDKRSLSSTISKEGWSVKLYLLARFDVTHFARPVPDSKGDRGWSYTPVSSTHHERTFDRDVTRPWSHDVNKRYVIKPSTLAHVSLRGHRTPRWAG
jgi:hypothetical protein